MSLTLHTLDQKSPEASPRCKGRGMRSQLLHVWDRGKEWIVMVTAWTKQTQVCGLDSSQGCRRIICTLDRCVQSPAKPPTLPSLGEKTAIIKE
jgi:hypothetical protein